MTGARRDEMKLDKDYFNSLELKPVKKKYYNLGEVDRVLVDIRAKALEMNEENLKLRKLLFESEKKRSELNDALIKSSNNYREILETIKKVDPQGREEVLERVADTFTKVKKYHEAAIEEINKQMQELLSGIVDEDAPEDLKQKVGQIALELGEINAE